MDELLFEILAVIFMFSFALSLYIGMEFRSDVNLFEFQFNDGMHRHKKINFNGPSFNWNTFFSLIFISNLSLSLMQFSTDEPIEGIRFALFLVHYPLFLIWIAEHILLLRGEAFVESLRVPWQT
jgi:hypothetical protein